MAVCFPTGSTRAKNKNTVSVLKHPGETQPPYALLASHPHRRELKYGSVVWGFECSPLYVRTRTWLLDMKEGWKKKKTKTQKRSDYGCNQYKL